MSSPAVIRESITIQAPLERCFALSTRIELVQKTLHLKAASGVTTGHIVAGSKVVWRGWKFGLPVEHHTCISAYAAPDQARLASSSRELPAHSSAWFQDTQERGRFAFFQHDHLFHAYCDAATGAPTTKLSDEIRFTLPFGWFGRLAARLLLMPYIQGRARHRFAMIKELAEGEGWRDWTSEP